MAYALPPSSRMSAKTAVVILASLVGLATCGPIEYEYAPTRTTGAELRSSRARSYGMPPAAPRGEVRVTMLGVEPLRPTGGMEDATLPAAHVVLGIDNRDNEAWLLVGAEQYIELDGKPTMATTWDVERPQSLEIPPRTSRSIDLYFPLVGPELSSPGPRTIDLVWTVRIGPRVFTQSTQFERFLTGPAFDLLPPVASP